MNDRELDRLIVRANPYGDQTVADLPTGGAGTALLEEIMSTSAPTLTPVADGPGPRRSRRRPGLLAVAAVTVVLALAGVVLPRGGGPAAPPPAYAAEVVAVAEANQRLLLDAPGWSITRVAEFTAAQGEMSFGNGTKRLDVHWRPAGEHADFLRDRSANGNTWTPIVLLGQTGTLFTYRGWDDFTTILPAKGQNFLEIRGALGPETEYRELIAKLHPVDVNTWLDALPASVVQPADKATVIAGMLTDIPVPTGFDARKLNTSTTTDRYNVGAEVAGAVTCAWIDRWTKARKSGDAQGVREAVNALKSSRSWTILREMDAIGDYPEVLWEYADLVVNGKSPEGYRTALGC